MLLLMFSAGLEIDLAGLTKVGRSAVIAGVLGVITPVLIAAPTAMIFGYPGEKAVFIGLILAATSVSISAQVMLELGVLRSREGLARFRNRRAPGASAVERYVVNVAARRDEADAT